MHRSLLIRQVQKGLTNLNHAFTPMPNNINLAEMEKFIDTVKKKPS